MRSSPLLSLLLCLGACASSPSAAETQSPAPAPAASAPEPESSAPEPSAPAEREASVKPGINDAWRSDNIAPLVARLEAESREIYLHRDRLAKLVGAKPGSAVADIGAGSGFMTLLLANEVGKDGRVFAVDINQTMLDKVAERAQAAGLSNVQTMLSPEDSTPLAPGSVDIVFMCDAYHHFEYPKSSLASIHAALRPGGQIVLVDFERIPGKTSPGMMDHVRAGKEVFRQEILDAGFELVQEHDVPELKENYVLRFRRK